MATVKGDYQSDEQQLLAYMLTMRYRKHCYLQPWLLLTLAPLGKCPLLGRRVASACRTVSPPDSLCAFVPCLCVPGNVSGEAQSLTDFKRWS